MRAVLLLFGSLTLTSAFFRKKSKSSTTFSCLLPIMIIHSSCYQIYLANFFQASCLFGFISFPQFTLCNNILMCQRLSGVTGTQELGARGLRGKWSPARTREEVSFSLNLTICRLQIWKWDNCIVLSQSWRSGNLEGWHMYLAARQLFEAEMSNCFSCKVKNVIL